MDMNPSRSLDRVLQTLRDELRTGAAAIRERQLRQTIALLHAALDTLAPVRAAVCDVLSLDLAAPALR